MNIFQKYPNGIFIETGSFRGQGIELSLSAGFRKIYSIECKLEHYQACLKKFNSEILGGKVSLSLGDSGVCLKEILDSINEPATIFLDAHPTMGEEYRKEAQFPLEREIEVICSHTIKTHTVLIDDVRLFRTFKTDIQNITQMFLACNPKYTISYDTYHANFKNDVAVIRA